jgi:hypothetical protein
MRNKQGTYAVLLPAVPFRIAPRKYVFIGEYCIVAVTQKRHLDKRNEIIVTTSRLTGRMVVQKKNHKMLLYEFVIMSYVLRYYYEITEEENNMNRVFVICLVFCDLCHP